VTNIGPFAKTTQLCVASSLKANIWSCAKPKGKSKWQFAMWLWGSMFCTKN